MIEAIRNAGYSTHVCTFRSHGQEMSDTLLQSVKRTLYTYVESEIPVILALYPESGDGHAVVLIGHGWDANIINRVDVEIPLSTNNATQVCHAVSWVNHFYIHNDNTGPYQTFPERKEAGANYFLEDVVLAIPLLPGDVYVSGEEADTTSRELLGKILQLFEAMGSQVNLNDFLNQVVIRTYLIDKHKFREWVRNSEMTKELKEYL